MWASDGGVHLDGQLDRRVVARLEVEELALVRAAPIAAVEDVVLLHVERRRDGLAVCSPAHEDEAQPMAVPLGQHHEELLVEVLPPQQPLVDGALVHVEGEREELGRDLLTPHLLHVEFRAHGLPLPPDLESFLRAEAAQEVVKVAVRPRCVCQLRRSGRIGGRWRVVVPVILQPGAVMEASLGKDRRLLLRAEVHMHRRHPVLLG